MIADLPVLLPSLWVDAPDEALRRASMERTGAALGTFEPPASRPLIRAALEVDKASHVVTQLEKSHRSAARPGGKSRLRVFVLACTRAV
jgi:hypothetical protein